MWKKRGDGKSPDASQKASELQDPLLVTQSSTLSTVPVAQKPAPAPTGGGGGGGGVGGAPPLRSPPDRLWAPHEPRLLQPEAIGHSPADIYVNIATGDVPSKYQDATRKARLATLDKACDDLHRSNDPCTYNGFDVTELLAPGERVVFSFPCIGFVNFPDFAHNKFQGGNCHVVLTEMDAGDSQGLRTIYFATNRQDRSIEVDEQYNRRNFTDEDSCCCCQTQYQRTTDRQSYTIRREGFASFGMVSVEQQLVNMHVDVVAKSIISKSRAFSYTGAVEPHQQRGARRAGIGVGVQRNAAGNTKVDFKLNVKGNLSDDEARHCEGLDEAITKDKKTTEDSLSVTTQRVEYYGLNIQFTAPEHGDVREVIAVIEPSTGKQRIAQFVRKCMLISEAQRDDCRPPRGGALGAEYGRNNRSRLYNAAGVIKKHTTPAFTVAAVRSRPCNWKPCAVVVVLIVAAIITYYELHSSGSDTGSGGCSTNTNSYACRNSGESCTWVSGCNSLSYSGSGACASHPGSCTWQEYDDQCNEISTNSYQDTLGSCHEL